MRRSSLSISAALSQPLRIRQSAMRAGPMSAFGPAADTGRACCGTHVGVLTGVPQCSYPARRLRVVRVASRSDCLLFCSMTSASPFNATTGRAFLRGSRDWKRLVKLSGWLPVGGYRVTVREKCWIGFQVLQSEQISILKRAQLVCQIIWQRYRPRSR